MANYNLTQTGAEVQELLNKVSLFGKFTCSDAADSQVKNIHIDDFTLIDSVAIAVTFVNGNSAASIRLNVNYTGNVPVYYRNSPLGAGLFTANATVILMYNATGNRWDVLSELCGTIGEAASRDVATEITDESSDEDIPTVGAVKGTMKGLPEQDCSFVFRKTAGGELTVPSGLAQLTSMRGKSAEWNQLIQAQYKTFNVNSGDTIDFSSRAIAVEGHVYLMCINQMQTLSSVTRNTFHIGRYYQNTSTDYSLQAGRKTWIARAIENAGINYWCNAPSDDVTYDNFQVFDLTQMFGAGNEPSTVEEFEAMFPDEYYPYNTGSLLNFNAKSLKTVGFNQWDEEWEEGYWNVENASPMPASGRLRTKNIIKLFPNTEYYIKGSLRPIFVDSNGNFIYSPGFVINNVFTTPDNTYGAKFNFEPIYGSTYNHDTCINLSDSSKNGTYEPYWESNLPLNINTLTGKLDGSGDSIVVFPNGMAGMNGVQDTIIGNTATKKFMQVNDLTTLPITLNYEGYAPEEESGDTVYSFILELPKNAKAFTASVMNGLFNKKYSASSGISAASYNNFYIYTLQGKSYVEIMDSTFATDARFADEEQWDALIADIRTSLADKVLLYELGTYEEYTLDDMAMPLSYKIDKYGTEQIIPNSTDPDNAVPSTVPCDMTVRYKLSYTEESRELLDNVSATQAQDFTNIQKNIARENIGIKADDIHLWNSSILENMNLYSQAFYLDINKASSLGATRVDVGGNMDMRSLWEKSAVSVLMDENGNYCELNPNDNRYTKEGDYLLNEDGTIVSAFAHCDFMKIIPLTYGRVQMVTENGSTFPRLWLSLVPLPGGYIIPQQVVAKFKASLVSNKMRSLPGLVTADSNTIYNFWTKAQARSKNHGLANLDFRNHLLFHMMSKYASRDSQNCKGQDNTPIWGVGLDGTENSGGFDGQKNIKTGIVLSLGDYDGNVATTDANSNTCHCVNVAGFENPWGQKWEMVQGLCSVGTDVYCWRNNWLPTGTPTAESFAHVEHVKLTRATSAVTGMNIIESQQGQGVYMIPKQSLSGVSYGDNFWYVEAGQLWLFGGSSSFESSCGLASAASDLAWAGSTSSISARLAYYGSLNKVSATKMKELGNTI